jgi:uncharacterized protein
MKRILLFSLLLLAQLARSQDIPPRPAGYTPVTDLAHVLSQDQIRALSDKLQAYNDSTSSQIIIVTVQSTGDYEPEEYALKILRDWGVGLKKNNNGVVILGVFGEKRQLRIEVGDGLEGAIPDITAKQIIENELAPNFRQENYYRGFDRAADALIKAAAGEYKAEARPQSRSGGRGRGGNFIGLFIFVIIIIVLLAGRRGGGGGGGTINRGGFLPWLVIGSMLNNRGGGGWGGGGGRYVGVGVGGGASWGG